MKKIKLALLIILSVIILAGCGKSAKEEFFDYTKKNVTENSSNDISMTIKDIKLTADMKDSPEANVMITQLKDIKVTGSMQHDVSEKATNTKLNIEALGQKIPLEFISKNDDMYFSLDIFRGISKIASQFNSELPSDEKTLSAFDGKYLKLSDADTLEIDSKSATNLTKEFQKEVSNYFTSLDEERFTKENDVVTFKLTKKDVVVLAEKFNTLSKSKKEYKEFVIPDFDEMIKNLPKALDVKFNLNTKTNDLAVALTSTFDKKDEGFIDSIEVLYNYKPNDKQVAIKLPAKKEIVNVKEIEAILAPYLSDELDEELDEELDGDFNMADDEFKELVKELEKEDFSSFSAAESDELLEEYEPLLTEKQYKTIEKIFKNK
ncbi:hypothetical protein BFR45_07590 [Brochothrix thermosphacta]|uniref:hypothetical protein n=1 Tax=Brochothrix thermosphacta TaxID=2756 RepID=UPI00083FCA7A|nr:hypothetical protein [Brochothrix thermosphacta]ODJ74367.1 hypothetical protein BFR45_07590 [Brochothrix thermosphacta]